MTRGKHETKEIERRYRDEIRNLLGIEPAGLTRDEATYILGFPNADALRDRAGKAQGQRGERLRAKGIQSQDVDASDNFSRQAESGQQTELSRAISENGIAENIQAKVSNLQKASRKVGDFAITAGQLLDDFLAGKSQTARSEEFRLLKTLQDTFSSPVALVTLRGAGSSPRAWGTH